ncbi:MAG: L-2-amino-thiazoline-4-carboxylic acid hydrolase [Candidatus Hodarchaeota archaeon]
MYEKSTIVKNRDDSSNLIKEKYDIALATQKFLLQICMAQWDGQWFLKSKREYGIEQANQLNQRVIFSMGKIEARHILNALGIKKGSITSIPELIKIINTFMDVIIPKVMKFSFIAHSDTEGVGIVDKCFIWKEVEKSKAESEYKCACNHRHRGWLESMGVNGEIIPVKRFSNGDNCCEFKFILHKNNK